MTINELSEKLNQLKDQGLGNEQVFVLLNWAENEAGKVEFVIKGDFTGQDGYDEVYEPMHIALFAKPVEEEFTQKGIVYYMWNPEDNKI